MNAFDTIWDEMKPTFDFLTSAVALMNRIEKTNFIQRMADRILKRKKNKDCSASSGDSSTSASSGNSSKACCSGLNSACAAVGIRAAVCGDLGNLIMCSEYKEDKNKECVPVGGFALIVDGKKIKPNCWYICENNKPVEVDFTDNIFSRVKSVKKNEKHHSQGSYY